MISIPASMLLQVFLLLSAQLLLASMLLSLAMLLLAPMLLQVFLLLLAVLLLALLHYECCSMMSLLLLFFPRPWQKSLSDSLSPWKETFCIPECRKCLPVPGMRPFTSLNGGIFWSLESVQVFLQGPDFYGMEACKISHCGDRKTFLAFWFAKGLLAGTRRVFLHGGMWKRSLGGKNVLVSAAGLSILGNGIFWWEAKTIVPFLC